jgi:RNA polymerase sigma-70 factor, ECF subfamily
VLRDVLGFHGREVAEILESTEESVTSALKRARATLRRLAPTGTSEPPPAPNSAAEADLIGRLTRAYETGDVDGVVALLTEDVWMRMPPVPLEYQGRELAARFHAAVAFRQGRTYRLVATRANGQPAFGLYVWDPHATLLHATGLLVLTLAGHRIRDDALRQQRAAPLRAPPDLAGLSPHVASRPNSTARLASRAPAKQRNVRVGLVSRCRDATSELPAP